MNQILNPRQLRSPFQGDWGLEETCYGNDLIMLKLTLMRRLLEPTVNSKQMARPNKFLEVIGWF